VNTQSLVIFRNLKKLTMRNNKKLTEVGDEITALKDLDDIKFSHCRILNLTNKVDELQKLVSIKLDNNQLKELPQSIGKLKNLETLNVSRNLLE
jgi:Leucine-rich repeat (LRR) protein